MISTLIFDLGNVLFRFDPIELTSAEIQDPEDAKLVHSVVFDPQYWRLLDSGSISDASVKSAFRDRLPSRLWASADRVYDRWYANMPEIPGIRELVLDLKKERYPLYILSNISEGFASGFRSIPHLDSLISLFDGYVFSGPLHLTKPSAEIYRYLIQKYDLCPSQCLFFDDSPYNVAGAASEGIESILFSGAPALRATLHERGILPKV